MMHDIDMSEHDDVRFRAVCGERDQGEDTVRFVGSDRDALDGLEVVSNPLDGAPQFVGAFFRAGDQNEIAGEGDQAFAKAGGVEGGVYGNWELGIG
jgi:hypothetical protein